ncbi:hypothetical protein WBG83_20355 [Paenibacillus sp. y28]
MPGAQTMIRLNVAWRLLMDSTALKASALLPHRAQLPARGAVRE